MMRTLHKRAMNEPAEVLHLEHAWPETAQNLTAATLEAENTTLNGICAYFTMFPLVFPYEILSAHAQSNQWVLDPFCGRGTTNYASRLLGLPTVGIDSHPLAVALSQAKLVTTNTTAIVSAARRILEQVPVTIAIPNDEFWKRAFHPDVLILLCRLREGLLYDCRSAARKALRAILLGALHGPLTKTIPSYFSNQMPRTFAPKPAYSVRFWQQHNLDAPNVDVLELIKTRATHYFGTPLQQAIGRIIHGDSRNKAVLNKIPEPVHWVITSPPYYGMRTYLPDQWLRLWFLGGPAEVVYSQHNQVRHSSVEQFTEELRQVWRNVSTICDNQANLIIRFGGINDRKADPVSILEGSFAGSGWRIRAKRSAGSAAHGRRQSLHFATSQQKAIEGVDVWAVRAFGG